MVKFNISQTRVSRHLIGGEVTATTTITAEIEAKNADEALQIFDRGEVS